MCYAVWQHRVCQLRAWIGPDAPGDDHPVIAVQQRREIYLSRWNAELCDVGEQLLSGRSTWKSRARRFGTSGGYLSLVRAISFLPHVCECKLFFPHDAPHNLLGDGHAFPFKKMVDAPLSVPTVVLLNNRRIVILSFECLSIPMALLYGSSNSCRLQKRGEALIGGNAFSRHLSQELFPCFSVGPFVYQFGRILEASNLYLGFMSALTQLPIPLLLLGNTLLVSRIISYVASMLLIMIGTSASFAFLLSIKL